MPTYGLTAAELRVLRKLESPARVQDFLNQLPQNFEPGGSSCRSPRRVLRDRTAHCLEGAILAALALRLQGYPPLLLDLKATEEDDDHVAAVWRGRSGWGAITKTNHAVLRYREPIYRSVRELAASYFHEYFLDSGRKVLRSYSTPLNLARFDARGWVTAEADVWYVAKALDAQPHHSLMPPGAGRALRLADPIERATGKLTEWSRSGKRQFR